MTGENRTLVERSTVARLSHSATATLAPGARVERACPAFQTGALTATATLANLVEEEGIEPSSAGCRPAVLPLNDSPKDWLRAGELNATRMAYEASMTPVHLPALKAGPGSWGRTSGRSIIDRVLKPR